MSGEGARFDSLHVEVLSSYVSPTLNPKPYNVNPNPQPPNRVGLKFLNARPTHPLIFGPFIFRSVHSFIFRLVLYFSVLYQTAGFKEFPRWIRYSSSTRTPVIRVFTTFDVCDDHERRRNLDLSLPEKGNSDTHGARLVHQIITMIKWIRTSRLSIENSLSTLADAGCC